MEASRKPDGAEGANEIFSPAPAAPSEPILTHKVITVAPSSWLPFQKAKQIHVITVISENEQGKKQELTININFMSADKTEKVANAIFNAIESELKTKGKIDASTLQNITFTGIDKSTKNTAKAAQKLLKQHMSQVSAGNLQAKEIANVQRTDILRKYEPKPNMLNTLRESVEAHEAFTRQFSNITEVSDKDKLIAIKIRYNDFSDLFFNFLAIRHSLPPEDFTRIHNEMLEIGKKYQEQLKESLLESLKDHHAFTQYFIQNSETLDSNTLKEKYKEFVELHENIKQYKLSNSDLKKIDWIANAYTRLIRQ